VKSPRVREAPILKSLISFKINEKASQKPRPGMSCLNWCGNGLVTGKEASIEL